MHQTVGCVLRKLQYSNSLQNLPHTRDIGNKALATAIHAMQVTVASALCSMPRALAFRCS
eukprot:CCRYP_011716-RA/>CCRYP_011716-RA protein AED:0.03 eAED:0.03 QI:0/-1/0/1/-1/0/1/0/59